MNTGKYGGENAREEIDQLRLGHEKAFEKQGEFRHPGRISQRTPERRYYFEYYLIKVNNFDDIAKDTLDEWIYFLKNEEIKDGFKAKGLEKAKRELDILKLPEKERIAYERHRDDLHYQASMVESSYKIGEIKGEKKGEKRTIVEEIGRIHDLYSQGVFTESAYKKLIGPLEKKLALLETV